MMQEQTYRVVMAIRVTDEAALEAAREEGAGRGPDRGGVRQRSVSTPAPTLTAAGSGKRRPGFGVFDAQCHPVIVV